MAVVIPAAVPTWDEFKARYPKFGGVNEVMFARALEAAKLYVDPDAFGPRYHLAVEYKTAALLESGKYGQVAPLPSRSEMPEYEKRFLELRAMVPKKGLLT